MIESMAKSIAPNKRRWDRESSSWSRGGHRLLTRFMCIVLSCITLLAVSFSECNEGQILQPTPFSTSKSEDPSQNASKSIKEREGGETLVINLSAENFIGDDLRVCEVLKRADASQHKNKRVVFEFVKCNDLEVGNRLPRIYMLWILATSVGADYTFRCKDAIPNSIFKQFEVVEATAKDTLALLAKDSIPTLQTICQQKCIREKTYPQKCRAPGLELAVKLIQRDFRRFAEQVGVDEDMDADVALHYRCGDAIRPGGNAKYGLLPHSAYEYTIREGMKKASFTLRKIAIVTQPYDTKYLRLRDRPFGLACKLIVADLVEYLNDKFPGVEVDIFNDVEETIIMTHSRLVLAKHVSICGPSSFCLLPTVASYGKSYIYKSEINRSVIDMSKSDKNIIVFSSPKISPSDAADKTTSELIQWLRTN